MNNTELKETFMTEEPVTYGGIEYKRVSAIIYRKEGEKTYVQAELLDKNANSVTIARPDRIDRISVQGGTSL